MKKIITIFGWTFGVIIAVVAILIVYANYRIRIEETLAIDAEAPGRFFTVQGHRLHVQTIGDVTADPTGTPIVLVHGFIIGGHASFLPWAREKLASSRSLILPDMLGYGHSEHIVEPGEHYTLASYARDLAALLDALGVQRVDLVGHSWGGAIATQFAHDYPERVRRLALIDAAIFMPKDTPLERIISLPFGIGRAVTWSALGFVNKSTAHLACKGHENCELLPPMHIKDTTETQRAMMYTSRHTNGMAQLDSQIGSVVTPALVLHAKNDPIVPLANAERLAHELASAKLIVMPSAQHMLWLEHPQEVAHEVLGFLTGG